MKKLRLINLIVLPLTLISSTSAPAVEAGITEPKNMEYLIESKEVDRAGVLKNFFEKYNSPLKENANKFVEVADQYGLDYRFLPSISCVESGCAKALIENSYNPFGWGVYGTQYIAFKSYDEAIEIVGDGLYKNYISKGFDTLEEIAPIYTPPNPSNWKRGIRFFSDQMDLIAAKQ